MSESERESGEENIDESGRNPTQRRLDEEGAPDQAADATWDETVDQPHEGEEGQEPV
jgi:hypothetical protein